MDVFPHALDFDWRFDTATIDKLCSLLAGTEGVLALGAPSVARELERLDRNVTLVDRQPSSDVSRHILADIDLLVQPITGFSVAIVDAPWYQDTFLRWLTYAAACVGAGGVVLASAWPASTRPGAEDELEAAAAKISEWGTVRRLPIDLAYRIPRFERLAIEAPGARLLSVSPRIGLLLKISVNRAPKGPMPLSRPEIWQRFVVDDYQLALRLTGSPEAELPQVMRVPEAVGWRWPFVSARAPGRSKIDLWSSDSEVASVRSPTAVARILRQALSTTEPSAFENALHSIGDFLSWNIPRPPYRRLIEWQHRQ